jgi:F-type H+-transporting ATPase subunit gamma
MPSLIDLRRRIRAVKNTQQITKAMKMIAASRLRKAQDRILSARPFSVQMQRVLTSVAARVDPSVHPLLDLREMTPDSRTLMIVITADKGLCGSFNTNVIKEGLRFATETRGRLAMGLIGRKGRDFFKRRGLEVILERVNLFSKLDFQDAAAIAAIAMEEFTERRVDAVYLVYNEFKSVMQQRVVVDRLLPIPREDLAQSGEPPVDYLYEPEPGKILNTLLPGHVRFQVFRALLESAAAEHAARMTAMDAATKNSGEVIESLTLYMNKVRQAAITREIIEVVSGAQAK